MSNKIIEMVAENDFVSLKPVLESLVAKKLVEKVEAKKQEFIAELKSKKSAKKG